MTKLAERLGMWSLLHNSRHYCLANVGAVAEKNSEFFSMDKAHFEDVLTNENMKVPKEETVVELLVSWVAHDRNQALNLKAKDSMHFYISIFYLCQGRTS